MTYPPRSAIRLRRHHAAFLYAGLAFYSHCTAKDQRLWLSVPTVRPLCRSLCKCRQVVLHQRRPHLGCKVHQSHSQVEYPLLPLTYHRHHTHQQPLVWSRRFLHLQPTNPLPRPAYLKDAAHVMPALQ